MCAEILTSILNINQTKKRGKKIMARPKGSLPRAPGMTQISISLPKKLVEQIDKMADAENRNRSNFIANTLFNLAQRSLAVAEPKKNLK